MPGNLIEVGAVFDGAPLKTGMNEVAATVERNTQQMSASFQKFGEQATFSMNEAKGSMALLGEEIGVKVPRHLRTFIADLPGVGVALSSAFNAIAIIAVIDLVIKATEHFTKLADKIRDSGLAMNEAAFATEHQAESLRLTNLKIEDQIAKLEHKISPNHLAIALLESKIKADELAGSLSKAVKEEIKLLDEASIGAFRSLISGKDATSDVRDEVKPHLQAIEELVAARQRAGALGLKDEEATANASIKLEIAATETIVRNKLAGIKSEMDETLRIRKASWERMKVPEHQINEQLANDERIITEAAKPRKALLEDMLITIKAIHAEQSEGLKNEGLIPKLAAAEDKAELEKMRKGVEAAFHAVIEKRSWVAEETKKYAKQQQKAEDESALATLNVWDMDLKARTANLVQSYKEQTDAAIGAGKEQEQLIEQQFLRGKISHQKEIAELARVKQEELQQEIIYLRATEMLHQGDALKIREIEAQITAIVRQQSLLRSKAITDGLKAEERDYKKVVDGMTNAFSSFTQSIMSGNDTVGQSFAKMVNGMATNFISSLERQLAQFLVHLAVKDAADHAASVKSGLRAAIDTARGTYKHEAPLVGPIIAGIEAGAAFAAVMAFGSAEGGQYMVPGPQLTMLHPQEMVLNADLASRMRSVIEGGGSGGGGGNSFAVHFNVSAFDAEGVDRILTKHRKKFTDHFFKEAKKKGWK